MIFASFFDAMMAKYTIKAPKKRQYHRDGTLSKAEVMLIMILFHGSGYRCLKHFYLEHVTKHLRHLFPHLVSYNRFVELEREVAIPLALFIKKVLLGKCTGISFVDSTPLRCARISASIFIRLSKASPRGASARWAGSSDSSFTSSATRRASSLIS